MEVQGKIIEFLPLEKGVGKTGKEWRKSGFVIETNEQYPKQVAFIAFNDGIDRFSTMQIGAVVNVSFAPESRKWQDKSGNVRWSTDLRCINVGIAPMFPNVVPAANMMPNENSDLPFM